MGPRRENDTPGSREISVADVHLATEISFRVLALQREAHRVAQN